MMHYPWPGNVRELQSAINYALIKPRGKIIQPVHLPMELRTQKVNRLSRGPSLRLDSKIVKEALIRSGGNKAKSVRYLGVGKATLYRFLNNFSDIGSSIYESE